MSASVCLTSRGREGKEPKRREFSQRRRKRGAKEDPARRVSRGAEARVPRWSSSGSLDSESSPASSSQSRHAPATSTASVSAPVGAAAVVAIVSCKRLFLSQESGLGPKIKAVL
jgi:hypothetical protein